MSAGAPSSIRDDVSVTSARAHAFSKRARDALALRRCGPAPRRLCHRPNSDQPFSRNALQVLAVDGLGLLRAARLQQQRAEHLARRLMPDRRLVVRDARPPGRRLPTRAESPRRTGARAPPARRARCGWRSAGWSAAAGPSAWSETPRAPSSAVSAASSAVRAGRLVRGR